ncbi:SufE family protein [Fimbriimonas ginsengisoli]|nr:SufE family protein [Fimbriimonas ginsengisoli]
MPEKLKSILEDLSFFTDRNDRIQALIELGEEFRNPSPEELPRNPTTRVPGCESEVYVDSEPFSRGKRYRFAVDNPQGISAMALARILDQGLSGEPVEDVQSVPDEIVYDIFGRELSMGKSLGLTGMVRMVKSEAAKTS